MPRFNEDTATVGNGFLMYVDQFTFPVKPMTQCQNPNARDIARLAEIELAAGRVLAARDAQPLYLRNKVALTMAERQARKT
jgi:tRNA threonylcarbamoyladenosine biosynthesis protein TsaB